jgi:integrase
MTSNAPELAMASFDYHAPTGRYHIRFRWEKPYKRSLKLVGDDEARRVCAVIEETIQDLRRGKRTIPPTADPAEFIFSGGRNTERPSEAETPRAESLTLGRLWALYEEQSPEGSKAETTRKTEGYHKGHLLRILGEDFRLDALDLACAQRYARARSKQKWRGTRIGSATILKEVAMLRVLWNWGRKFKHLAAPFPFRLGDLEFERTVDRAPFQTVEQIRRAIERGNLSAGEVSALWECLYLTLEQVHEVLEHVRATASHSFIHPMFAFVAMTGARRSEICRARVEDFDFENRVVTIREKKRKRGRDSFRKVDMNSQLVRVIGDWFSIHPGGPFAITKGGEVLSVDMATDHFKRTLAGSKWSVIPGFHTFRHSFASILASKGVDEPTIDKWMGHQTPEQRERYRHLFPQGLKRSIELLSDAAPRS